MEGAPASARRGDDGEREDIERGERGVRGGDRGNDCVFAGESVSRSSAADDGGASGGGGGVGGRARGRRAVRI